MPWLYSLRCDVLIVHKSPLATANGLEVGAASKGQEGGEAETFERQDRWSVKEGAAPRNLKFTASFHLFAPKMGLILDLRPVKKPVAKVTARPKAKVSAKAKAQNDKMKARRISKARKTSLWSWRSAFRAETSPNMVFWVRKRGVALHFVEVRLDFAA